MRRHPRSPLRLRLETVLDCSAELAWAQELEVAHLLAISGPVIVLRSSGGSPLAGRWTLGAVVELRGYLFGVIPLSRHKIEVRRLDPRRREIETHEAGGFIKLWRHRVAVLPLADGRCRYCDDLLIDAGRLTRLVWLAAAPIYRLRQRRRRKLAARLG